MVMCNDPVTRTPWSGFSGAYFSRIAIRPGISFSAMEISLRPQSAREMSATLWSVPCFEVVVVFIKGFGIKVLGFRLLEGRAARFLYDPLRNRARKTMKHGRDLFRLSDQPIKVCFRKKFELTRDVELRAKFTSGTFCDVQETNEIFIAAALVAFGNVRWNRERRSLNLVLHREVPTRCECFENINGEPASTLPDFQIFKRLKCHNNYFLKPEPLNLPHCFP